MSLMVVLMFYIYLRLSTFDGYFYVNTFLQRAHTFFPKHKNKCINFDGDLMYSFSFLSSSTEIAQICTMK